MLNAAYHYLDLVPKGRDEEGRPPQYWLRRRDEYGPLSRLRRELRPAARCSTAVEGRPRDERESVVRAQRGDACAFEELVRAHWEVMFRVAVAITGDAAEAEDVAQEALAKAWRALPRFRAGEPVRRGC